MKLQVNPVLRAAKQEEIKSICDQIQWAYTPRCNGVIIEDEKGGIGAMAVYERWTHTGVEMHAYSAGPQYVFHPRFMHAIFAYPFIEQQKLLAIVCTPCDNTASLAIGRFFGFRETYRIRDGWNLGTDMVIQELRRENCRFLEQNHVAKKSA